MENILVVIPARGGSKGVPKKNIKLLNGKPLIYYSIDVARNITKDENICVTTDDDEIMEMIKKLKPDYDFSDYLKSRPHKILIMGGGENIYRDIDKEWHSFEKDGSLIFWKEGKTTATVKLEGFLEWSLETKNINSLSSGNFPWQDWNNLGILFAQKLAEQLPENYYVYYGFNPHDSNNQGKKPFRILK